MTMGVASRGNFFEKKEVTFNEDFFLCLVLNISLAPITFLCLLYLPTKMFPT